MISNYLARLIGLIRAFTELARAFYTERQIYVRSDGRVQFITLPALTQLGLLLGAVAFLCWVAFASVNVIFKEQIITAKDRRYVKMRAAYEERIAELERAYEEINGTLILAQENFLRKTAELEDKHRDLRNLLIYKQAVNREFKSIRNKLAGHVFAGDSKQSANRLVRQRDGESPVDQTSGTASLADTAEEETVNLGNIHIHESQSSSGSPGHWQRVAALDRRLAMLHADQLHVFDTVEIETDNRIARLQKIIKGVGIDPDQFVSALKPEGEGAALGGPLIKLGGMSALADSEEPDDSFEKQLFRLGRNFNQLSDLYAALDVLPLVVPVKGDYRFTSQYGPRIDPFRKRAAFHSGIDLAGHYRTPVYATAPGVVSHAGRKGAYGRLVEIDHGNGIKSRYGHLHSVNVKEGDHVEYHQEIGKMGSSGRSTGTHLHYEVWLNGKTQNPMKFLEAGQHVFKSQG